MYGCTEKTSLYDFRKLGINRVNKANEVNKLNKVDEGRFGNFYTKTYEVEFSETELNSIMKEELELQTFCQQKAPF